MFGGPTDRKEANGNKAERKDVQLSLPLDRLSLRSPHCRSKCLAGTSGLRSGTICKQMYRLVLEAINVDPPNKKNVGEEKQMDSGALEDTNGYRTGVHRFEGCKLQLKNTAWNGCHSAAQPLAHGLQGGVQALQHDYMAVQSRPQSGSGELP